MAAAANLPVVYAIDPNTGSPLGGTSVTLHGSGFTGATSVLFGTTAVSGFSVSDDDDISVRSPPGTAGTTVHVTVVTPAGSSVPAVQDQFSYVAAAAPAIYGLSPNSGTTAGGTPLTIYGSGFTGATSISFGSTTIPCSASAPALSSPASAGAKVSAPDPASIFQPGEMAAYRAALKERVFNAPTLPLPTSRGAKLKDLPLPESGVGQLAEMAAAFQPRIQSVPSGGACSSGLSDGFLSVLSPPGSSGAVEVNVTTASGTSVVNPADRFTYTAPAPPTIYAIDPHQGPFGGGTAVTIHGSGFAGASEVRFYGTRASFFVGDDSQIFATSPPGFDRYTVDVIVLTPAGQTPATPGDQFTYLPPSSSPPVISAIDPRGGPAAGGTEIVIYGSGLSNPRSVTFGTTVVPCNFGYISDPGKCFPWSIGQAYDNALFVTTPAGSVGTIDIKVTTQSGTSAVTSADTFTYVATSPPVINAIHPAAGPATGGTTVQILGSGFTGVTAIKFGANAATFKLVIADDDNRISVTSPAGVANTTIDVQITTPSGTSAVSAADRFAYTVPLAPVIKAIDPNHGPGGTPVTIYGDGFSGATAVNFGSVPGRSVSVNSDNSISVVAPAGSAGRVGITVTTSVGTSPAVAYTNEVPPPPAITYLGPTSGPTGGGTIVYITGSGFLDTSGLSFGATAGTSISVISDRLVSVTSPPGNGQVQITLSAPGGNVVANTLFTYSAAPLPSNAPPEVDALGPNQGTSYGGQFVAVYGRGFTGGGNVQFGSDFASFTFAFGDTSILVFRNPAGTPGATVDVRVTTANGISAVSPGDKYTYQAPQPPVVLFVQPDRMLAVRQTNVVIAGHWLSGATDVRFGSVQAQDWFAVTDDTMSASGPRGTPGTVDVTVTTPAGVSPIVVGDQLTYVAETPPVVSAIGPRAGPAEGGTTVYISGSGLLSVSSVRFGAIVVPSLRVTAVDDGLITVTSPPGIASAVPVDVTVTTPLGTSPVSAADQYTYGASPPSAVSVVSPNSGPANGGALVNVEGTGLFDAVAVNFGPTPAFSFTAVSDGLVQAISPPGAASTTVDVTVTTRAGTTALVSGDRFTYTPANPPLAISAVGPSSGPSVGGTVVYIMGSGLGTATAVSFGSFRCTNFVALSDGLIRAVSPTGAVGSVDVSVTTPAGTTPRSGGDVFTYQPASPPSVTAVAPAAGGAGSAVFVTGTGLFGATSIHFGSVAAVNPTMISDTLLRVLAPPAAAGSADVTVSTAAGTSASTSADRFTYSAPVAPSVTVVSPNSGPQGTVAFITGRGLGAVTSVVFGTMAADFMIDSDTLIEAPAPNGTGSVDVTVASAAGTSPTSLADVYTFTAEANPVFTVVSRSQYQLHDSDGIVWQDMDATNLVLKITPAAPSLALITGNADLWTANAGYNQDLGLDVDGTIVGWKESGGYAGTFSPNAAFAQGIAVMLAGPTYTVKLKWKTNRPAPGTTILAAAGAGPVYSPTRLTVELLPLRGYNLRQAASITQYRLLSSDGATWMDMDPGALAFNYTPQVDGVAIVSGNADLWTANNGFNQDIGLTVSGGLYPTMPGQPEAWKESGGYAGTFSPNAAFVQTAIRMTANTTYAMKLQWKANLPAPGATIFAGAGPIAGAFSPTHLALQFIPAGTGLSDRHSESQYNFPSSNGANWQPMDAGALSLSLTPAKNCVAIVSANADLWTANAGYNQDVGIAVSGGAGAYPTVPGQPEAWKESGGFAGTFSPNAAYVQGVIPVALGTAYSFQVVWKANKDATGATLFAGAGPIGSRYSSTRLTVRLVSCS